MTAALSRSPIVRAAVVALDAFGAVDRATAANLLDCWARRVELTDAERETVLSHYGRAGAR